MTHTYLGPQSSNMDILLHFVDAGGSPLSIRNMDPDKYGVFDIQEDVNGLPETIGIGHREPFSISFLLRGGKDILSIKTDRDVLRMFELNPKFVYIHVYASSMKKGFASGGTGLPPFGNSNPFALTDCRT